MARQPHSGSGPPHFRGFAITLRHITLGRTPLDEWSARGRDLWQHTTLTKGQSRPRQDSNLQSQQASGRRPTTYISWPIESAMMRIMMGSQSFYRYSHLRRFANFKSIFVSQVQCVQMIGIQKEKLVSKSEHYTIVRFASLRRKAGDECRSTEYIRTSMFAKYKNFARCSGVADKSLARPGRKQDTATKF